MELGERFLGPDAVGGGQGGLRFGAEDFHVASGIRSREQVEDEVGLREGGSVNGGKVQREDSRRQQAGCQLRGVTVFLGVVDQPLEEMVRLRWR